MVNHNQSEPFFNNVYFAITTITTVGYGDFLPISTLGRIVNLFMQFYGGFIISLLVVSVGSVFALSKNQETAFHKLIMVKKAARAIVAAMRLRVMKVRMKKQKELISQGEHIPNNIKVTDKLIFVS